MANINDKKKKKDISTNIQSVYSYTKYSFS